MSFIRTSITLLISACLSFCLQGQCEAYQDENLSPKIASYDIDVVLDNEAKFAKCKEVLTWKNTSPDTIRELRFYMYMNSFKNTESSFIKRSNGQVFGQDIYDRPPEEWGYIEMTKIVDGASDLTANIKYIQPDFPDSLDQSVLSVPLETPILPGESRQFNIDFDLKMPLIMARAGYSLADYYLFVHWFPQMGVYEADSDGKWGWNCRQFIPGTEFFADFGNYKVTLDLPENLTVGASGCRIAESHSNNQQKITYQAYDIIDFAWVVYSRFEEYTAKFKDIDIRLLIPTEHLGHADRMILAAQQTLEYLDKHVGPYPYPTITVVDPPLHGLRSGLMEYPMLITCGSFYGFPKQVRSLESLVVHELTHMYFMAVLATNEKEEAWMDEGFVTYFEDRILDHYYGDKGSLFNIFGYRSGNKENSRLEYTSLDDPAEGVIGVPGWDFKGDYKALIYAKTATTFQTVQGLIGKDNMDKLLQSYYEKYKFTHPKGRDFINHVSAFVETTEGLVKSQAVKHLLEQAIYTSRVCDYELVAIRNIGTRSPKGFFGTDLIDFNQGNGEMTYHTEVIVKQNGNLEVPVKVKMVLKNGKVLWKEWDGKSKYHTFTYSEDARTVSAHIDPDHEIYLDIDFSNNSQTAYKESKPSAKYASKAVQWVQNILQSASLLF